MAETHEPGTVSTEVGAQLLMLSNQRLFQLEQAGWIKRVSKGVWRTVDLVQGYIKFLKDEEKRSSKTATLSRVQEARAKEIELRTARDQGLIVDMSEARAMVVDVVGGLKANLDGLPARCTRDLAVRRRIEAELNDVLKRTADRLEQQGAALRTGGEATSAAAEVDA